MRYSLGVLAGLVLLVSACSQPCPPLDKVVLDEDSLQPDAARRLLETLGKPTWHHIVDLKALDPSTFEGQTAAAIRVAQARALGATNPELKVDLLVWERRCRGRIREGIVALVDPRSKALVGLEASTALGERPLVIVRSRR